MQHPGQGRQLVAHLGGAFESQLFGKRHHAGLQIVQNGLGVAIQKAGGPLHVGGVVGHADELHARATAPLDLVQQAGPGAVGKHGVFAGAQPEHLLHELDGFLHRPGAGIGAEILVLFVHRAPVVGHARVAGRVFSLGRHHRQAAHLEVGIAFVVLEQDVEPRVERFDEVIFEQQSLGLAAHHRGFHAHDARDHVPDARATVVLVEVAGNSLLEVAGFANVEHVASGIEIAVNAGQGRQAGHLGQQARPGLFPAGLRRGLGGVLGFNGHGRDCRSRRPG